jgi:hypothetical protein
MRSFTIELCFAADPSHRDAVMRLCDRAAAIGKGVEGVTAIDRYLPSTGETFDPYVDDGEGPLALLLLHVSDEGALRKVLAALAPLREDVPAGVEASFAAFERSFFNREGEIADQGIREPFVYVVRYHRPADDEAAFVAHYLATHARTLAHFPDIANVICYVPLPDVAGPFRTADYMLGNEVVFPHRDAFNAAMVSPVRQELRREYETFPAFTGVNTHYPMDRERVLARAG